MGSPLASPVAPEDDAAALPAATIAAASLVVSHLRTEPDVVAKPPVDASDSVVTSPVPAVARAAGRTAFTGQTASTRGTRDQQPMGNASIDSDDPSRVPSRLGNSRRVAVSAPVVNRWTRWNRTFVAIAATTIFVTTGLPAYAADPTQVSVVAPTTLVPIAHAEAEQAYTSGATSGASLTRDAMGLQQEAAAADDSTALTAACTVAGADLSGSIVYPLPNGSYHLTSGIGYRYVSALGRGDYHTGQDFAAPLTTSIFAVADGTVTEIGNAAGATYAKIRSVLATGETVDFYYLHEYPDGVFVTAGQKVTAGEKIAEVGNTGISTGPHMHLEIHDASTGETSVSERSTMLDPLQWLKAHGATGIAGC